jgi:Flp pilus assembly protein TadG
MDRTMSRTRTRIRHRRGQALVEAALVLPLLLLVLVGIMEVGRAWNIHQVVTHAAREGARAAAVWHDTGNAADSACAVAGRSLAAASVAFDCGDDLTVSGDGAGSEEVEVTVDIAYNFILLGPVLSLAIGPVGGASLNQNSIHLTSKAVMRNE